MGLLKLSNAPVDRAKIRPVRESLEARRTAPTAADACAVLCGEAAVTLNSLRAGRSRKPVQNTTSRTRCWIVSLGVSTPGVLTFPRGERRARINLCYQTSVPVCSFHATRKDLSERAQRHRRTEYGGYSTERTDAQKLSSYRPFRHRYLAGERVGLRHGNGSAEASKRAVGTGSPNGRWSQTRRHHRASCFLRA